MVDSPAMSRTSSTMSIVDNVPNSKSMVNLRKQIKFCAIGAVLVWYFSVPGHLRDSLSLGIASTLEGRLAAISLAFLVATVAIFAHIIVLPARGHTVAYADWANDPYLRTAIPALTACIVIGWSTLLITLSPIGAPAPPALSLATRIQQAARSIGIPTPDSRATAIEALGLNPAQSSAFHSYLTQLTTRADAWAAHNIRTIGWTGALAASIGTYLFVFGSIGLIGFFAPDNRTPKHKQF